MSGPRTRHERYQIPAARTLLTDRGVANDPERPMPMTFRISTTPDGAVLLAIEGELDSMISRDLREELEALVKRRPPRVEVDLSRLLTIDSAGVGTLVASTRACAHRAARSRSPG